MKKIIKFCFCLLLAFVFVTGFRLWQERKSLQDNFIRLHVVANSDSEYDQQIKLRVKDSVVAYLQPIVKTFSDKEEALAYIRENLPRLQELANEVLEELGAREYAVVSLLQEEFTTREYDTFSLPAGIYDALRIEIGKGEGENWWCVAFPTLCVSATSEGFCETAASFGISDTLSNTLTNQGGYKIRFFLLDCIGNLENLFH